MSEMLSFMMGKFEAKFPTDRLYAKNHMWAQPQPSGAIRFGFSAYAVRLLQDVYFLDWSIDAPTELKGKQLLGSIESKKAESELYAPLEGILTEFNATLLKDPSAINVDTYGEGWLFEMQTDTAPLLTPTAYLAHLEEAWVVAQRTIKGQVNED
jgi:glycine cleavage system H protein